LHRKLCQIVINSEAVRYCLQELSNVVSSGV